MDNTCILKNRALSGGRWFISLRFLKQVMYLIRIFVLARLLSPKDFGVFGIALLVLFVLDSFSKTGFQNALIQKKGSIQKYLDAAWTIEIIRGGIIALIIFTISPFLASFFNAPPAASILKIIAVAFLFEAAKNISVVYFEKNLNFKKYFIFHLLSSFIELGTAILFAAIYRNVWALAVGNLAGNLTKFIASYWIDPYRPKFNFDTKLTQELFKFGKWVLGAQIINFFTTKGDDVLVGKVLGASALGFYQMAYLISNLPSTEITTVISKILFPVYSQVQDNLQRMKHIYIKAAKLSAFFSFPVALIIIMFAFDFIHIVLGDKWLPILACMQVLTLWGIIRSIGASTGPVFYAIGRPRIATQLQGLQFLILAVIIFPLTFQSGFLGTAIAVVLASIIPNILAYQKVVSILKIRLKEIIYIYIYPLINTAIMALSIYYIKLYVPTSQNIFFLIGAIVMSLFIYILSGLLSESVGGYSLRNIIKYLSKERT